MEFNKKEMNEIQVVASEKERELEELSALQLALVGGGVGEVIFG